MDLPSIMNYMKRYFSDWSAFELFWLPFCCAALTLCWAVSGDGWLALTGSLAGAISMVLCAKGKIENYPFGLVQVLIYAYLFYKTRYYGQSAFQMILAPIIMAGMISWNSNLKASDDTSGISTRKLTTTNWYILIGALIAITVLVSLLLNSLNGFKPYGDAVGTALGITAALLMVLRYSEQWYMWMLADAWYIILWLIALVHGKPDSTTILVSWIIYLLNAVYGYYSWRRLEQKRESH